MIKIDKLILFTAFMFVFLTNAQSGPTLNSGQDKKPWNMKWEKVENMSDEFNGSLDFSKWHTNPKGNGWTWIGRPPGLFEADSFYTSEGTLCCEVKKYNSPKYVEGKKFNYKGGIIRSYASAGVGHYFECKMKANATEMSSTFWLKPRISCGKNLELDIQECVGATNSMTKPYAIGWDKIMHSNMFDFKTPCHPSEFKTIQLQGALNISEKNSSRYFVYGCYIESPTKVHFFLDGQYIYSITPPRPYDIDMFITMAMETYDWNPISSAGDFKLKNGTWTERTTRYDWVRTWKLVNDSGTDLSIGETFFLENRATGKLIRPQSDGSNSKISQAPNSWRGGYTRWTMVDAGSGRFHLRNHATGRYIEPVGSWNNAELRQVDTPRWGTQWTKENAGDGYFYLKNSSTGKYFRPIGYDDLDANTGNNYAMQLVPTSLRGHFTQWKFVSTRTGRTAAQQTTISEEFIIENKFDISPTLAHNFVNITTNKSDYKVYIIDLNGVVVKSLKVIKNTTLQVDITNVIPGLYFIKYISELDGKVNIKKIIIK